MNCRHCITPLQHVFLDLGFAPPSNAYLSAEDLHKPELYFPLKLYVCDQCWLVQTEDYARSDELFTDDYAYFSSTSSSWLQHASEYCAMITKRFSLNSESLVMEVASNDGYLLKNFVNNAIPCLGIEPTANTAAAAEKLGIPVRHEFFGATLAQQLVQEGKQADLIIGNNVYAHVPDINDFTQGLKIILKQGGTITLEFPHLLNLIDYHQFDTVYHEHYSYLSLFTVQKIFAKAGLRVFDVEELETHGGSLRIYGCYTEDERTTTQAVAKILNYEYLGSLRSLSTYQDFQSKADHVKNNLLHFILEESQLGSKFAAYGAAAKGNTLLNYAGIKPDLIPFVCDAAASKQGKYMPGSHIPIVHPNVMAEYKPSHVLILPWNIKDEIIDKNPNVWEWGGNFVTAVPQLSVS